MATNAVRSHRRWRRTVVTAHHWHPPITPAEGDESALSDVHAVHRRRSSRHLRSTDADPFWSAAFSHQHYLSVGQRQAARTVVLAPAGSTTIVCLPTGHGKTEVALAPALLSRDDQAVSVIVVPTVVLALDMERRTSEEQLLRGRKLTPDRRFAYAAVLPDVDKQQIRDAVREG